MDSALRGGRRPPLATVLLYQPCPAIDDPAQVLPLGVHFRGRGWVICRTAFGPQDLHLAIQAGPYAAGPDQADKGNFTLYGYGADLAIDSGYGNDGDDHKSGSSFAHNVVLIDGHGQPMNWHNQSSGHITGFDHTDLLDWVRVDAKEAWSVRYDSDWRTHPTYPVERADRTFLFVRGGNGVPPYVVVYDDIVKDAKAHDYTWQWHIPANSKFDVHDAFWRAEPQPSAFGAHLHHRARERFGDVSVSSDKGRAIRGVRDGAGRRRRHRQIRQLLRHHG